MSRVLLGDVAFEHKESCKGSKTGYPSVGLDHLVPEEIVLNDCDDDISNTFTKIFRKGNVLFGRRRAYLKKAAVAPFDGICSGDIIVIEADPDLILPELLPFVIQNDRLFDFAIEKSAGSLSPRVKWEQLKNYEFELPEMEEQKKLANLLWAIVDEKIAYKKLIHETDELVKSQFIEMFNDETALKNKWLILPVSQILETPLSGEWGEEDTLGNGVKVIRTANFTDEGHINYADVITRSINDEKVKKKTLREGDILIEKSGGSGTKPVGRVVYYKRTPEKYTFNNFTGLLRVKDPRVLPKFLFEFLYISYWNGSTKLYENKTTGMHNLRLSDYLNNMMLPVSPIDIQKQFVAFADQSDKSKFVVNYYYTIGCIFNSLMNNDSYFYKTKFYKAVIDITKENKWGQCVCLMKTIPLNK